MLTNNEIYTITGNVGGSSTANICVNSSNNKVEVANDNSSGSSLQFQAKLEEGQTNKFALLSVGSNKYLCSSDSTKDAATCMANSSTAVYLNFDDCTSFYNVELESKETSYLDMEGTSAGTQVTFASAKSGNSASKQKWVFTPVVRKPTTF